MAHSRPLPQPSLQEPKSSQTGADGASKAVATAVSAGAGGAPKAVVAAVDPGTDDVAATVSAGAGAEAVPMADPTGAAPVTDDEGAEAAPAGARGVSEAVPGFPRPEMIPPSNTPPTTWGGTI